MKSALRASTQSVQWHILQMIECLDLIRCLTGVFKNFRSIIVSTTNWTRFEYGLFGTFRIGFGFQNPFLFYAKKQPHFFGPRNIANAVQIISIDPCLRTTSPHVVLSNKQTDLAVQKRISVEQSDILLVFTSTFKNSLKALQFAAMIWTFYFLALPQTRTLYNVPFPAFLTNTVRLMT